MKNEIENNKSNENNTGLEVKESMVKKRRRKKPSRRVKRRRPRF